MLVLYDTEQIKNNFLNGDLLVAHNPAGCFLVSIDFYNNFELISLDDVDVTTGGLQRFTKLDFDDLQVFIANRQCEHISRQDFQLKIMKRG